MSEESRGERIKRLRKSHGLTQQQLADAVGVSKGLVSHWEKGVVSQPQTDALYRLAEVLHTDVLYLLWGDKRKSPAPAQRKGS